MRMSALYDGQELERQRISRELHDGLGQMLVALKMKIENSSCINIEKDGVFLEEFRQGFKHTIEEVRRVSYDLAPAGLYDFKMDVALKMLCEELYRDSGIKVEFSCYGAFIDVPEKIKNYLFRIAQEALNNAIRHSHADHIEVHLSESQENLILMVEDNGKGFRYSPESEFSGNGLYNMKERARLLGGSFDLESSPGKGTMIRVKIPKKSSDEKDTGHIRG